MYPLMCILMISRILRVKSFFRSYCFRYLEIVTRYFFLIRFVKQGLSYSVIY